MSKAIPEGFHTVTPHMIVAGAAKAIEWYRKAFGAEILHQSTMPGTDKIMHATVRIGDSPVMLADEFPEWGSVGPQKDSKPPITLHMYVQDADAAFKRATDAGATVEMPLANMFWGDRYGIVRDPFGHRWSISTKVEDVPEDELEDRAAEAMKNMGKC